MTTARGLDVDGARCYFHSNNCTEAVIGQGGLDEHHAWPAFMGGPGGTADTPACPNHHRRQHALLRYLIERDLTNTPRSWLVLRRYTVVERHTAQAAVGSWINAGRPPIRSWNTPAARDA